MSPPTIPSPNTPAASEVAHVIIGALRERGYDVGITDHVTAYQWKDFDIMVHWGNLSVGSKRRNRSYLQVTWSKRELLFTIYGHRWSEMTPADNQLRIDLADPESLNKIVDFIVKVATQDEYKFPFI